MPLTVAVHTSTFRPEIDRWIAADGADVVIRATESEASILRFNDGQWIVSRNPAACEHDADPIEYLGDRYRRAGETIAAFGEDSPIDEWERVYARCFRG